MFAIFSHAGDHLIGLLCVVNFTFKTHFILFLCDIFNSIPKPLPSILAQCNSNYTSYSTVTWLIQRRSIAFQSIPMSVILLTSDWFLHFFQSVDFNLHYLIIRFYFILLKSNFYTCQHTLSQSNLQYYIAFIFLLNNNLFIDKKSQTRT